MSPRSLQNRLLLSFFVGMTVILTAGGFVIYKVIGSHLESENDALLRDRLRFYETTLKIMPLRGAVVASFRWIPAELELTSPTETPWLAQAWMAENGKEIPFPFPIPEKSRLPRPSASGQEVIFLDHTLQDGRAVRLCSRVFVPAKEPPSLPDVKVQVVVARDLKALDAALAKIRWFLIKIGLAVLGVVLIATRLIIRRGVKPVNSLAHQIEVIPLADEGARFGLPGAPSELQPVVGRLNALMDRVGAAIDHERQFASNAAHELRNPLAAIRSKIEVVLSRNRKAEEYEEALESIWQSQQGMQRVVDHLLLLARLESGHRKSEFHAEPAQLGRMLKKAWRGCIDIAEEKKLRVAWHVEDPDIEFLIPVSLFEIVFTNLLENAVNYTPAGGEIRIHALLADGECRVAVENTNPGLREDQLEQTFAPFWRGDPNASGHRGNAGIGLALCRRIATTLGGTITAAITPSGMVRYSAALPFYCVATEVPRPSPQESSPSAPGIGKSTELQRPRDRPAPAN